MASSGNRAPIDPESWDSCVGQLITKAESGELPIYGTASRGGRPKLLPPSDFSGVLARRVYKAGYLYLIGPADEDGPYGTKFQDQLYFEQEWHPGWCGLRANKADVKRLWPFDDLEVAGREGRGKSGLQGTPFNRKTATEFVEQYIAREKEVGLEPSVDRCRAAAQKAGKKGGRPLLDAAYREQMKKLGYSVKAGRRQKKPQEKSARK